MIRKHVWTEAQEEFLISCGMGTREEFEQLSDDGLKEYYYKVICEKGIKEKAEKFVSEWCRLYK